MRSRHYVATRLSVIGSAPLALTLHLHSITRGETVPQSDRAIRKAAPSELGTHSGQLQLTVRCRASTAGRHVRAADQSLTQQFRGTGASNQMANGGDVTLQDQLTGGRRGGGGTGARGPRPHLWPTKVGPYCLLAPPLGIRNQ